MADVAKRLGAVGLITDCGVRDVDTVHQMGSHMFAVETVPAHGNVELDETMVPVEVGRVVVNLGDVVRADLTNGTPSPAQFTAKRNLGT